MDLQKVVEAELNFDLSSIDAKINLIRRKVDRLEENAKTSLLQKAIGFIDLTSLGADDTPSKIEALCIKAVNPLKMKSNSSIHTASVCVYPLRFPDLMSVMGKLDKEHKVNRDTVGGGFPSGQFPLEVRVREVEIGVELGADEIDIVINRPLVLMQQWNELYEELKAFRSACNNKILKVILSIGELQNLENVYKASMVAIMAGADFIKTSTGKEAVNATLESGIVMCHAISDYYRHTKKRVGFKPAGGIKSTQQALEWIVLVQTELGDEWLTKNLFRIGASSLLDDIVNALHNN